MQKKFWPKNLGCGLHEILRGKEGLIYGILNGIDIDWHHTARDSAIKFPYGPTEKELMEKLNIMIGKREKR